MSEPKTKCKRCGASILVRTSERTGGLCVPCKEGRGIDRSSKKPVELPVWDSPRPDRMLIDIEKISEDDDTVEYRFSSNLWMPRAGYKYGAQKVGRSSGTLCLDKHTGEIVAVEIMPEDKNGDCCIRAEVKIRKHWEKGEFPEKTYFASG